MTTLLRIERPEQLQCQDEVPDGIRIPFQCELLVQIKRLPQSAVYVASYKDEEDLYAIKLNTTTKAHFDSTICLEVEYLKRLEHCNVAKYFGLDFSRKLQWDFLMNETESGRINYFLTLRYYPGNDLNHWATEHKQSSPNHKYMQRFLCDLLHGLDYLHSHELCIIHCDIKPDNLVLHSNAANAHVIIIDFEGVAFNSHLKQEALTAAFTPRYAAPELLRGMLSGLPTGQAAVIGGKIDVWSVGCVAVQLCTGELPEICKYTNGVPGESIQVFFAMTSNLSNGTATVKFPVLDQNDPWNRRFIDFISQCLEFVPSDRKSAEELLKHEYISTRYEAL